MINDFIVVHTNKGNAVLINTKMIISATRDNGQSTLLLLDRHIQEDPVYFSDCVKDHFKVLESPEEIYNKIYKNINEN